MAPVKGAYKRYFCNADETPKSIPRRTLFRQVYKFKYDLVSMLSTSCESNK